MVSSRFFLLVIFCSSTIAAKSETKCKCAQEISGLSIYSLRQVSEHRNRSISVWVSYRSGVYDITKYIDRHPGGLSTIMAGAGTQLEFFWKSLPVHLNERVFEILEEYRIGNLKASDRQTDSYNPFSKEKSRSYDMEVIAEEPYNANPYPVDLSKSMITPNRLHYVRLHLPIPWIDAKSHKLTISGIGLKSTIVLSMANIKKNFPHHQFNVTLQCSGNRRAEMNKIKLTHGVAYKQTAISTATWGGIWLLEVLKELKIAAADRSIKYVNFEGADQDASGMHYGTSIPREMALDPETDLFLAYEMNGVPLPRDHGYPLRLIAPGMAGFRSVKFLYKITFATNQLTDIWEQRLYRFYAAKYYWDNINYASAPGLYYTNVQSAILTPNESQKIKSNQSLVVKGYAFSGGGNGIRRVDVTLDSGEHWIDAFITNGQISHPRRDWTWVFWQVTLPWEQLKRHASNNTILISCRAFDSAYNSQPSDVRTIWNMMGVLVNHWHTINVMYK